MLEKKKKIHFSVMKKLSSYKRKPLTEDTFDQ